MNAAMYAGLPQLQYYFMISLVFYFYKPAFTYIHRLVLQ